MTASVLKQDPNIFWILEFSSKISFWTFCVWIFYKKYFVLFFNNNKKKVSTKHVETIEASFIKIIIIIIKKIQNVCKYPA